MHLISRVEDALERGKKLQRSQTPELYGFNGFSLGDPIKPSTEPRTVIVVHLSGLG